MALRYWLEDARRNRKSLMFKKLKVPLWFQVLIAMALGLTTGLLLAPSGAGILSEHAVGHVIPWIALPGTYSWRSLKWS